MSSTNKTTYYDLPQFVDNDLFNPLVDDNDAYDKIDTALHEIAEAEAGDANDITNVKGRVTTVEDKVTALETQNGNDVLSTTSQTLSGAINELKSEEDALDERLVTVEDDINNVNTGLKAKVTKLETQNGNEVLTTIAQTISGAVNELKDEEDNIENVVIIAGKSFATITAMSTNKHLAVGDIVSVMGEFFEISANYNSGDYYISCANSLYAIYKPQKFVNASVFGCTANEDISDELQNAIDYAVTIEKKVALTAGVYYLDKHIDLPRICGLVGFGNVVLDCSHFDDSGYDYAIQITNVNSTVYKIKTTVVLQNIEVRGNDATITGRYPTEGQCNTINGLLIASNKIAFKDCTFTRFNKGVTFGNNAYCIYFSHCNIYQNDYGHYFDKTGLNNSGGFTSFIECSISGNRLGIYNFGNLIYVIDCDVDYNKCHIKSQSSEAGISYGCETYYGTQFESDITCDDELFGDISTIGSWRIFDTCHFMLPAKNGTFNAEKASTNMWFRNCVFRINNNLANFNATSGSYLVKACDSKRNVFIDKLPSWIMSNAGYLRMYKYHNPANFFTKGYSTHDYCTINYDGDTTAIVTATSATLGGHIEKEIEIPADARGLLFGAIVNTNFSTDSNWQYGAIGFYDESGTQISPSWSIGNTAVANTDQFKAIGGDLPIGATKIKVILNSKGGQLADNTTFNAVTYKDVYAIFY